MPHKGKGEKIQIFNYGNCKRDFTYVDDIVEGVKRVMKGAPEKKNGEDEALYDNHGTVVNCYSLNDLVSGINMSLLYLDIICKEVNEAATYQQVVENIKEEIEDFTQYISYHPVKNAVMLKEQFEDFSMETESELMFLLSKLKDELDEQVLVLESRISN